MRGNGDILMFLEEKVHKVNDQGSNSQNDLNLIIELIYKCSRKSFITCRSGTEIATKDRGVLEKVHNCNCLPQKFWWFTIRCKQVPVGGVSVMSVMLRMWMGWHTDSEQEDYCFKVVEVSFGITLLDVWVFQLETFIQRFNRGICKHLDLTLRKLHFNWIRRLFLKGSLFRIWDSVGFLG